MTSKELSRYYKLQKRLEQNKEMLVSLEAAAYPGAQVLTGMPHTSNISDKVGDLGSEIADLKTHIAHLEKECERMRPAVIAFVESIENDYIRRIIRIRFLCALTWKEVAAVVGGKNTGNGVKSAFHRYMKSCNAVKRDDT